MDPLSEVLSLLKLEQYVSGGFILSRNVTYAIPRFEGVKCYTPISGACWLSVEGSNQLVQIRTGDCVILPRGLPFRLSAKRATAKEIRRLEVRNLGDTVLYQQTEACSFLGGHFLFARSPSGVVLEALPAIVHLRKESDKAAIRWSLQNIVEESRNPQPGSSLIAQHLAYMLLVQALRLHLREEAERGVGLLLALADSQIRMAITCMHEEPAHSWTIQELATRVGMSRTVFAHTFREKSGQTPMQYLARWRMTVAAARLESTSDAVATVAAAVGYSTESAFGKAFRRAWGSSPRTYRRS